MSLGRDDAYKLLMRHRYECSTCHAAILAPDFCREGFRLWELAFPGVDLPAVRRRREAEQSNEDLPVDRKP